MAYLIIVIVAVALTIIALFWGGKWYGLEWRNLLANYILTLSGTFVGVFLAAQLASHVTHLNERETFIATVFHAMQEADDIANRTEQFRKGMLQTSDPATSQLIDQNHPEKPILIDSLIQSESFAKFSSWTRSPMILERSNMLKVYGGAVDRSRSSADRVLSLEIYVKELRHIGGILQVAILLASGEISDEEANRRLSDLVRKKVFAK